VLLVVPLHRDLRKSLWISDKIVLLLPLALRKPRGRTRSMTSQIGIGPIILKPPVVGVWSQAVLDGHFPDGNSADEWPLALNPIAGLVGFLGRKYDGESGMQTLWLGLRRVRDFAEGMRFAQGLPAT